MYWHSRSEISIRWFVHSIEESLCFFKYMTREHQGIKSSLATQLLLEMQGGEPNEDPLQSQLHLFIVSPLRYP